ncbi:hypothetical protein [Glutamicibacter sp. PS]|uniref:hypothetical protein n=1 Tax=Glutamicibacter sp. PS TaxID=3075634 RepID=UPI002845098A|nr:hypothetical protein [Glutamicibacter sp. PS]MDR4532045.1 hypothetical protein [Glutamicibacter sp. PS]
MEQANNSPAAQNDSIPVVVHRVPRFWPVILTFTALGVVAGAITGLIGLPSSEYTRAAAMGFFAMFFGGLGAGIGAVVYVVIDWLAARKGSKGQAVAMTENTDSGQPES